ncbi:MAG TPA: efflux RND transporter periplasmic adaptor subunit [Caulobacteraceae bacterium]|nr:efflux RND transporter periplasmic adaptor subunit [Caulobacteraceae bacterium]
MAIDKTTRLAGALTLALALLGLAGCNRSDAAKEAYRTAAVERGDVVHSVSASGALQALVTVQVGSQVSGQIKDVMVDFNSQVSKGQILAIIDPDTYASRVNQAQADLSASQATLNQLQAGLKQAEAQAAVDLATFNRTKMLFEKGIDSPSAMDTAQATYQRSVAAVESARAALAVQRARITQSQASLKSNQVDLGRTRIVSPISGVVVNRAVDPGQTVQASFQAPVLFQIAQDLSKLQVKILVDEADIGQVREGQAVKFTVDAYPDQSFEGQVTQVRKQPETQSNVVAYEVIAQADNPRGQLLPGMTANADIQIERRTNVLKVPVAALRFKPADQRQTQGAPRGMGVGGFGPPPGGGGFGRGGGGGGGGFGGGGDPAARERMYDQLGLTPDQRKRAKAIADDTRGKLMGVLGDRDAMRKLFEDGRTRFEALLTADQKTRYEALRAQMAGQAGARRAAQMGVVYVLADGKPKAVPVRVGPSDGSFTEIQGPLKPGDEVIVGGGPQPKLQMRGPIPGMGGGQKR